MMQRGAAPPEIGVCEMSPFPAPPTLQTDAGDSCGTSTHDASAAGVERAAVLLTSKDRALTLCFSPCHGTNHQDSVLQHTGTTAKFPGYLEGKGQGSTQGSQAPYQAGPEKPRTAGHTYWRAAISDLQKQSLGCLSSLN